jgi:hypothetical protein
MIFVLVLALVEDNVADAFVVVVVVAAVVVVHEEVVDAVDSEGAGKPMKVVDSFQLMVVHCFVTLLDFVELVPSFLNTCLFVEFVPFFVGFQEFEVVALNIAYVFRIPSFQIEFVVVA